MVDALPQDWYTFFVALFILLLFGTLSAAEAAQPLQAIVIVPVADVWSRPVMPLQESDELRETQVLYGEQVLIHESSGPWVRIEAIEQPEFTHHNLWEGYPGWILAIFLDTRETQPGCEVIREKWREPAFLPGDPVPLGAKIGPPCLKHQPTNHSEQKMREEILKTASLIIGENYLWGGMSPKISKHWIHYGYDCSGLVHVAYRVNGITIPRDSHEQWMKAKPIKRTELKPGDLIFSAKADNPKKITHVAMFVGATPHPHPLPSERGEGVQGAGDGQIIEAPQTGMVVRKISFKEKYGKELSEVESGDKVGDRVIYFGSYLHEGSPADGRGG